MGILLIGPFLGLLVYAQKTDRPQKTILRSGEQKKVWLALFALFWAIMVGGEWGVSDFLGIRGLVSRYFGNKSSMGGAEGG